MIDSSKKYQKNKPENMPHVGNFINYYIVNQKLSKAQLARDLDVGNSTLNQYFKNESIQLAILWKISKILNHNFVAQLAEYLYLPYKTKQEQKLEAHIALLEKRIEILEIELNVYKKIHEK